MIPNIQKIYFSSPFEYSRAGVSWKSLACSLLDTESSDELIFTGIDPCPDTNMDNKIDNWKSSGNWHQIESACQDIVERDLAMLRSCNGMLCYMPKNARTFGCTHEIIFALEQKIPVILVAPDGLDTVSRWLWGLLGVSRITDNLDSGVQMLTNRLVRARGALVQ